VQFLVYASEGIRSGNLLVGIVEGGAASNLHKDSNSPDSICQWIFQSVQPDSNRTSAFIYGGAIFT
jgi:hypothetical protein